MGFRLKATIADKSTEITPPTINLSTFGVTKGIEVSDGNCPDGILTQVRNQFKKLSKAKNGKKSLTISWYPLEEHKSLFTNLKKKKLRIMVFVEQYKDKGNGKWMFVFDDVQMVGSPKPDYKDFKDFKRKDERIDATFQRFEDDPE